MSRTRPTGRKAPLSLARRRQGPSARTQLAEYRAQGRWSLGVALAVIASAAFSLVRPGIHSSGSSGLPEFPASPIGDGVRAEFESDPGVAGDTAIAHREPASVTREASALASCRVSAGGVEAEPCDPLPPALLSVTANPTQPPLSVEPLPSSP